MLTVRLVDGISGICLSVFTSPPCPLSKRVIWFPAFAGMVKGERVTSLERGNNKERS
jgi:hypothetical protein